MRYFLVSLGVVLLIIFGIVIINSGSSTKTATTGHKVVKLSDYATKDDAFVRYQVQGPINALENHVSMSISISSTTRTLDVFEGYQNTLLTSKTYANDDNSYSQFLAALNHAGFLKERSVAKTVDPVAVCPTSNRTHYYLVEAGKNVTDLWSTTCLSGSFAGSTTLTGSLFKTQIPDYDTIMSSASSSTAKTSVIR